MGKVCQMCFIGWDLPPALEREEGHCSERYQMADHIVQLFREVEADQELSEGLVRELRNATVLLQTIPSEYEGVHEAWPEFRDWWLQMEWDSENETYKVSEELYTSWMHNLLDANRDDQITEGEFTAFLQLIYVFVDIVPEALVDDPVDVTTKALAPWADDKTLEFLEWWNPIL